MSHVTDYRKKKLWEHLIALQTQVGYPLRKRPRTGDLEDCPIANFAPDRDREGRYFNLDASAFAMRYDSIRRGGITYLCVYKLSDSDWWCELNPGDSEEVTRWVMKKLRRGDNLPIKEAGNVK